MTYDLIKYYYTVIKVKVPLGSLLTEPVIQTTKFSMSGEQTLDTMLLTELCTPSVTHPWCGSAFTDTTDNLSEKCRTRLTEIYSHPEKMLVSCHLSEDSYKGRIYSSNSFHKLL